MFDSGSVATMESSFILEGKRRNRDLVREEWPDGIESSFVSPFCERNNNCLPLFANGYPHDHQTSEVWNSESLFGSPWLSRNYEGTLNLGRLTESSSVQSIPRRFTVLEQEQDGQCLPVELGEIPTIFNTMQSGEASINAETGGRTIARVSNNRYGRKGNDRCAECRRRKTKVSTEKDFSADEQCIYESKWIPCQYCQSKALDKPCFKLSSQGRSSEEQPAWSFSPGAENDLSPQEILLMGYVYSKDTKHLSLKALCRIFANSYGPMISVKSLQSAIIARFSSYLPAAHFSDMHERHKERAWRELIRKTQSPSDLKDADLFAAFILATIAWDQEEFQETLIHYRGCLAIYEHITKMEQAPSDLLAVFAPYALNTLSLCDKIACITSVNTWDTIIQQHTPFTDRIRYFENIQQRSDGGMYPGAVEAVQDYLDDMVTLLITAILEVAIKEMEGHTERDSKVSAVIRLIEAEISIPQFGEALNVIKRSADDKKCSHNIIAECLENQLHLVTRILHGRTILESLDRRDVNSDADELISHYRAKVKMNCSPSGPRGKFTVSALMLGGVAFSRARWNKGTVPETQIMITQDGQWLLEELKNNPYSGGSEIALAEFWSTRDNRTLVAALRKTSQLSHIIV